MMENIVYWLMGDPIGDISLVDWEPFGLEMAVWLIAIFIGVTVLTVLAYALSARAIKIRRSEDLYGPFTPIRWLLLSLLAPIAYLIVYAVRFQNSFNEVQGYLFPAVKVAFLIFGLTLVSSYQMLRFPFVTPPKFKYRPRLFMRPRR